MIERFALLSVSAAHGLKGELKCFPLGGKHAALPLPVRCYAGNDTAYDMVAVRDAGKFMLVRLEGIATREQAEGLRGQILYVDRDAVEPPAEGTWFLADLLGLEVWHEATGDRLGKVSDIRYGPAQDLLVIAKDGEADLYLPAVGAFLLQVEKEKKRLTVRLPDGLLELYRGPKP